MLNVHLKICFALQETNFSLNFFRALHHQLQLKKYQYSIQYVPIVRGEYRSHCIIHKSSHFLLHCDHLFFFSFHNLLVVFIDLPRCAIFSLNQRYYVIGLKFNLSITSLYLASIHSFATFAKDSLTDSYAQRTLNRMLLFPSNNKCLFRRYLQW